VNSFGQRALFALAGLLGRPLIALYFLTVRIVDEPATLSKFNKDPGPPGVYAFWHAHQLAAVWHFRRSRAGILISVSKDGEYIARIARSLNFQPVRGSSSRRGAPGLKRLIELAQRGVPVAITPDGPRGPRYAINPGVLALAQKSGRPIIPFGIGLSDFWELPSWDRFRIPRPFSRGVSAFGRPIHVPPDADEDTLTAVTEELRRELLALEARLDRLAKER
jgi:hypothetical protein